MIQMKKSPQKNSQAGVTLVEMAFVVVAIGVILGIVVKGGQMYRHSQLTGSYMNVQAYKAATAEFIGQYNALPGDMGNATRYLSHSCGVADGGNNHVIGDGTLTIGDADASPEITQYWCHLLAAGLVEGFSGIGAGYGNNVPAAPLGGGYAVQSIMGSGNSYDPDGGSAIIKGLFIRWEGLGGPGSAVVTPSDAMTIDEKYDDGLPWSGVVRARGTDCRLDNDEDNVSSAYNATNPEEACYMYFQIKEFAGL